MAPHAGRNRPVPDADHTCLGRCRAATSFRLLLARYTTPKTQNSRVHEGPGSCKMTGAFVRQQTTLKAGGHWRLEHVPVPFFRRTVRAFRDPVFNLAVFLCFSSWTLRRAAICDDSPSPPLHLQCRLQ